MSNLRQHIRMTKLDLERPRYIPRGGGKVPERNNIDHGIKLHTSAQNIHDEFEKLGQQNLLGGSPELVFSIDTDTNVEEKHLERSGLIVLDEDLDKKMYVLTKDGVVGLMQRIQEYGQEPPSGQKNPRNNWLAALTGEMETIPPEKRMGTKLRKETITPETEYRLDIEFWAVPSEEENQEKINLLRKYVGERGGELLDSKIARSLTIARVKINGEFIQTLLEMPAIRIVDFPPSPELNINRVLRTGLEDFQHHPISDPPQDAQGICIIDSGVMPGHPMLSTAIGDIRAFPNTTDGVDENGHGTMVGGIALYGDVKECIDSLSFEPTFHLYSARVLNEHNHFDDDQLIVTQMREAIEYFNHEYGCRIFNISIGDPDLVYDDGKPSAWAYILDTLVRDLNIVIVVSTGNLAIIGYKNDEALALYETYPNYFIDGNKATRIIEPATAANVITVGSLTHTERPALLARYPDDLDIRPVGKVNNVSPFTRRGPGINNAIKPEVCEYGGNVLWRGLTEAIEGDRGLGIISTNMNHAASLFATDIGSSLAAPKVTNLVARIWRQYPNSSANLIRALIASAACEPIEAREAFENMDDRLNLYGYGKPEPERALYSDDNRVTFVADDAIRLNSIQIYEIPIPEEFQTLHGVRKISVSLAYDSPVRNTRLDYIGIKMSFRLIRGLQTQQIVDWYSQRTGTVEPDNIPPSSNCPMTPSPTRRETSTLQKATFSASQNRAFTDYTEHGNNFHLLLTCRSIWASQEEFENQRYGLAVTVEHEDTDIQLYNILSQRVQARQRARVRS